MKRFSKALAAAIVAGGTTLAAQVPGDDYCGTPHPGPWWPPHATDIATSKHVEAGALLKVAAALIKCHQTGVASLVTGKPSPVATCIAKALLKYDGAPAKVASRLPLPARAAPDAARTQVEALVRCFKYSGRFRRRVHRRLGQAILLERRVGDLHDQ